MKRRWTFTCLLVVLLILLGTATRPDDGTPYSVTPVDAAALVTGTSHPEPLPDLPSGVDLVELASALWTLLAIVLVLANAAPMVSRRRDSRARLSTDLLWLSPRVRRGPPSLI